MPLTISAAAPTIVVRKAAFERAGISRADIDRALNLTDQEFRVERELIAVGPIFDDEGLAALVRAFEDAGLVFFEDFFELSGNWPEWLSLFAMSG